MKYWSYNHGIEHWTRKEIDIGIWTLDVRSKVRGHYEFYDFYILNAI